MVFKEYSQVLSATQVAERKEKCESRNVCYISLKEFENEADVVVVDGFKVKAIYAK